MNIWCDYNPVRITAGQGAIKKLFSLDPPVTTGKRVLMVTSAGFTARGMTKKIEAAGRKSGLENPILVFDGVTANPELDFLDRIITALRRENITGIIALGGGSVLDTAKVFSVALPAAREYTLDNVLRQGRPQKWENRIPVVAIPTTAGTGAEVTSFATVWDSGNKKKYSVAGEMVYPIHALVDPELTVTLPPKETLYTGLDTISHALESLWNKNRTPISETLALKALALANHALPVLINQSENLLYREMMQQAALLAGLAISHTRTAIAHAISYPVTMRFGVPHGLACSFTLPKIIQHYKPNEKNDIITSRLNDTLIMLEGFKLNDKIAAFVKREDLLNFIGEMFYPERLENYAKPLKKEDITLIIGK